MSHESYMDSLFDGHEFFDEPSEDELLRLESELEFDDEFDEDFMGNDTFKVHIVDLVDGATSLQELAERMHNYANELFSLSDDGWELVDDIMNGRGKAEDFSTSESNNYY